MLSYDSNGCIKKTYLFLKILVLANGVNNAPSLYQFLLACHLKIDIPAF